MFTHLLVPLDGSLLAEAALPPAIALAEKFESQITLLRVIDVPRSSQSQRTEAHDNLLDDIRRNHFSEANQYLKEKQAELQSSGHEVHTQIVESEATAVAILETVNQLEITAVVMSTHGRGGLNRLLFGSVAEKVLRQCSVPVVVVRDNTAS